MKLNILPASAGLQWIKQSLGIFKRRPLFFIGLAALYFLASTLLSALISTFGIALTAMIYIYFCLAFILATDDVTNQKNSSFSSLIGRSITGPNGKKPIFLLSCAYACTFIILLILISYISNFIFADLHKTGSELLLRLLEGIQTNSPANFNENETPILRQYALILLLTQPIAYIMSLALFYVTPALVYGYQIPTSKAVFFNLMVCFKNMKTFVVFGLAWIGLFSAVAFAVVLLINLIVATLGGTAVASILIALLSVGSLMACFALFQIAIYFAYHNSFLPDETA